MIIIEKHIDRLSAQALGRFLLRARRAVRLQTRVNILVTSSAEMRTLNLRFRRKNTATDVLSFPADSSSKGSGQRSFVGEIAISGEIAARNAALFGHSPAVEVKILALHGLLHLAGFDHERDNGQMARKEEKLRRNLGLPSSLTERDRSERDVRLSCGVRAALKRARRTA